MVDDAARDRAIYHALKAADEVAAALQAHLIEEHSADLDRGAAQSPATDSLRLLRPPEGQPSSLAFMSTPPGIVSSPRRGRQVCPLPTRIALSNPML